jgi:hypothetical protein
MNELFVLPVMCLQSGEIEIPIMRDSGSLLNCLPCVFRNSSHQILDYEAHELAFLSVLAERYGLDYAYARKEQNEIKWIQTKRSWSKFIIHDDVTIKSSKTGYTTAVIKEDDMCFNFNNNELFEIFDPHPQPDPVFKFPEMTDNDYNQLLNIFQ